MMNVGDMFFVLDQIWIVKDSMQGMELIPLMESDNKIVIDTYNNMNLLETKMNEQDCGAFDKSVMEDVKSAIESVMVEFLFEPLDGNTLMRMEELIAHRLVDVISTDYDISVTGNDGDDVVVNLEIFNDFDTSTVIKASYVDCPALQNMPQNDLHEAGIDSRTIAFDRAMEVL